jgi:hypothetical protein
MNGINNIVQSKIYSIRNFKVMLDSDLAELYGVETKRINEAVKNNPKKFPNDFMFELGDAEFEDLRSKFSTAKFSKTRINPKVFTEQGVYMLATILKSKTAIDVTIAIMRAFVKMRSFALTYEQIVDKLKDIDIKVVEHDEILSNVLNALSDLISDTKDNETRKIGFVVDER